MDTAGEGDRAPESPVAMATPAPSGTEKHKIEGQESPAPTSLAGKELDAAICYICRNYLADPVTTECGHNFCQGCITQHCAGVETASCPQCGETLEKRVFRSNTQLGSIVETFKQLRLKPGQSGSEGNRCEEHGKELTWFCKKDSKHLCEDCRGSPAHRSHTVIPMAKASHESKEEASTPSRSENGSGQEQEAISTQLQKFRATLRSETKQNKEKIVAELKKIVAEFETRGAIGCHVRVTLDPDTANPALTLSEDRHGVEYGNKEQNVSENPERFDKRPWVLGSQGFEAGTVYWEMEVGNEEFWVVGVAKESVGRKGWVNESPKEGIWAIDWSRRMRPVPSSSQSTTAQSSRHIRVCLNYEKGQVTFFNAVTNTLIHTVTEAEFAGERIRPFFGTKSYLRLCL